MNVRIAPYGRGICLVLSLAAVVDTVLIVWLATWLTAWLWLLLPVDLATWAWVLWFFRDPDREIPDGEGLLVSPADGRVADVTPLSAAESPLDEDALRVGIFMSIFDVHVNRSPAAGQVVSIDHRLGSFFDARSEDALAMNESALIRMAVPAAEGSAWPMAVRQVAGKVARRIVTDVEPGDRLERGQRFGMIRFGSRLEVIVPSRLRPVPAVEIGRRVAAGRSVLITFGKDASDDPA